MNPQRYWLRGGLIGLFLFIALAILWWLVVSIDRGCMLSTIDVVNMGGADCEVENSPTFLVFFSLFYFGVPGLFGFLAGSLVGMIYGKVKNRNKNLEIL